MNNIKTPRKQIIKLKKIHTIIEYDVNTPSGKSKSKKYQTKSSMYCWGYDGLTLNANGIDLIDKNLNNNNSIQKNLNYLNQNYTSRLEDLASEKNKLYLQPDPAQSNLSYYNLPQYLADSNLYSTDDQSVDDELKNIYYNQTMQSLQSIDQQQKSLEPTSQRELKNSDLYEIQIRNASNAKFSDIRIEKIKKNISKSIEKELQFSPKLVDFILSADQKCLSIFTENQTAQDWFEEILLINEKIWPSADLFIKKIAKLNNQQMAKQVKVKVLIPGPALVSTEYLKMLHLQNPALETKLWRVFNRTVKKDAVQLILGIGLKDLEILKTIENKPLLGTQRIEFTIEES